MTIAALNMETLSLTAMEDVYTWETLKIMDEQSACLRDSSNLATAESIFMERAEKRGPQAAKAAERKFAAMKELIHRRDQRLTIQLKQVQAKLKMIQARLQSVEKALQQQIQKLGKLFG